MLAVATFSSVKSANRSARVAERSLLAGMQPVLIPSREDDPPERVGFGGGQVLTVPGHGAGLEVVDGHIYMAIALRNGGTGLAVLHGWRVEEARSVAGAEVPDLDEFTRQLRDLYIPAGERGFWQGAIRDRNDRAYEGVLAAADEGRRVVVDLLYGDHEGGQRTIARFAIGPWPEIDGERAEVLRYWFIDRENPR